MRFLIGPVSSLPLFGTILLLIVALVQAQQFSQDIRGTKSFRFPGSGGPRTQLIQPQPQRQQQFRPVTSQFQPPAQQQQQQQFGSQQFKPPTQLQKFTPPPSSPQFQPSGPVQQQFSSAGGSQRFQPPAQLQKFGPPSSQQFQSEAQFNPQQSQPQSQFTSQPFQQPQSQFSSQPQTQFNPQQSQPQSQFTSQPFQQPQSQFSSQPQTQFNPNQFKSQGQFNPQQSRPQASSPQNNFPADSPAIFLPTPPEVEPTELFPGITGKAPRDQVTQNIAKDVAQFALVTQKGLEVRSKTFIDAKNLFCC